MAGSVWLWPTVSGAHPDLDEQIAAVTRSIECEPANAALYLRRAELYRIHQDWSRAGADYDRAAARDPKLTTVELARGQMYLEAGRLEQAQAVLDKFVEGNPRHVTGRVVRARLFGARSMPALAVAEYGAAIALATVPEVDWYIERARITADPVAAVAGLDEGIKRLGPLVTLVVPAIELEVGQKLFDAALARVDWLLAQTPRKETWLVRRAEILTQAGRPAEARAAYVAAQAALEVLPAPRRQTPAMQELAKKIDKALHAKL